MLLAVVVPSPSWLKSFCPQHLIQPIPCPSHSSAPALHQIAPPSCLLPPPLPCVQRNQPSYPLGLISRAEQCEGVRFTKRAHMCSEPAPIAKAEPPRPCTSTCRPPEPHISHAIAEEWSRHWQPLRVARAKSALVGVYRRRAVSSGSVAQLAGVVCPPALDRAGSLPTPRFSARTAPNHPRHLPPPYATSRVPMPQPTDPAGLDISSNPLSPRSTTHPS